MSIKPALHFLTTFCLTLLFAVALPGCMPQQASEPFAANDISTAQLNGDFSLVDHHGQTRTLAEFKGKVVVVLFGYTHCPDVCPTTLAEIALAIKQLGPDASRVQVLFITLDPDRDTQEVLARYVPAFDSSFLGLRGSPAGTAEIAKRYRVFYQKHVTPGLPGYTLDHTASSFVIDRKGKPRLMANYGLGAESLAHDLKLLLL